MEILGFIQGTITAPIRDLFSYYRGLGFTVRVPSFGFRAYVCGFATRVVGFGCVDSALTRSAHPLLSHEEMPSTATLHTTPGPTIPI